MGTPEGQGTTHYPRAPSGRREVGLRLPLSTGGREHLPENREEEEGEREQKRGKGGKGGREKREGKREGARKKKGHLIPKFRWAGVYSSEALASLENQPLSWL